MCFYSVEFGPHLLHNLCLDEVLGWLLDELMGHPTACIFWGANPLDL